MIWLYVKDTIPFLPKYFQDIKLEFSKVEYFLDFIGQKLSMYMFSYFDFWKVYDGTHIRQPRSLFCSNFVNSKMEFAVGRLYVGRHFNSSSKHEVHFEQII